MGYNVYSFNGIELRELPARDKTAHPYAYITNNSASTDTPFYFLVFCSELYPHERKTFEALGWAYYPPTGSDLIIYSYADEIGWIGPLPGYESNTALYNSLTETIGDGVVWSSSVIYNPDGSVRLAGSTPTFVRYVETEEDEPDDPGEEEKPDPVYWIYNGKKLPALPEWDKEKFPYAAIFKYADVDYKDCDYKLIVVPSPYLYDPTAGYENICVATTVRYTFWLSDDGTEWIDKGEIVQELIGPDLDILEIYDGHSVVWANHDILYKNSTDVYLAGSKPYEAGVVQLYSWVIGLLIGLLQPPTLTFDAPPTQPTAYLYNGIRLPALPEWDRGVYPYAVIWSQLNGYHLTCLPADAYYEEHSSVEGLLYFKADTVCHCKTNEDLTEWGEWEEVADDTAYAIIDYPNEHMFACVWTNFNAEYDGTTYMTASEPIPVYE